MPYPVDTEIDLNPALNKRYFISSAHRKKNNPNKSVWSINHDEEVACFVESQVSEWIESSVSWGLRRVGNAMQLLGYNFQKDELKIAKFVDGAKYWHGYPADFIRKSQDRPGVPILTKWRNAGIIHKHQITKIRRGVECGL